jgi:hypothetical protein
MRVAPISTYIGQFFSGAVDPSTPHLVLILAAVIGGLAVGIGIICEAARSGHLWTLPTVFVFFGVVIEAAATVILFEFDEGISQAQQSKIIELTARLAPRRILPEQQKEISGSLKNLAKPSFAFTIVPAPESARLMLDIGNALEAAGWTWVEFPHGVVYPIADKPAVNTNFALTATDVGIQVPVQHQADWNAAATTLERGLNSVPGITATVFSRTYATFDGVLIYVGAKP